MKDYQLTSPSSIPKGLNFNGLHLLFIQFSLLCQRNVQHHWRPNGVRYPLVGETR
jgi:hypothetical protein